MDLRHRARRPARLSGGARRLSSTRLHGPAPRGRRTPADASRIAPHICRPGAGGDPDRPVTRRAIDARAGDLSRARQHRLHLLVPRGHAGVAERRGERESAVRKRRAGMTALAPHIEAFLREHLVRHRGASLHTCDSYAYSFRALFEFASQRLKAAPCALTLEQLDASLVGAFLEQLETTRRNGAATRNVRLAAIRAFFRFLQQRVPADRDQNRRVLESPCKWRDPRLVPYLTQEEVQALVNAPTPTTRQGLRDRAMLHLAICAGLRVSELTGLRLEDVASQAVT